MIEISKFGTSKVGVWVVGTLKDKGLEIQDIFNTNLKDESLLKENTELPIKKLKIRRDYKTGKLVFSLEF